jgi:hypothetical protein
MVFYNNEERRKEVGENCTLFLPDERAVPVSNVSYSEEANVSEVQYTDGFNQSLAVTGVTYSGSFTIPGRDNETRDIGFTSDGDNERNTSLPELIENMTIQDGSGRDFTFGNVMIDSHSKDIPSDDRTEHSFDFQAETLTTDD